MTHIHIIMLLSAFVLLITLAGSIIKRPEWLLVFLGRGISGITFIHFFNLLCSGRDIITHVSVNPATITMSCLLGIPGALLAFAIRLWGLF